MGRLAQHSRHGALSSWRRLWSGIAATLLAALALSPAHAQTFTADWTNLNIGSIEGVPSGSSVNAGPRTVTITHSQITNGGPFTNFYGTEMLNYWNGNMGGQTGTLLYSMDNDTFDPNDRFQTIYTFDANVTNLTFFVSHIDRANSPRHDGVTVEYDTGNGTWQNIRSNAALFTRGAVVGNATLSGVQGFHGTGSAGAPSSATGNLNVNFGAVSVRRVRIVYHFGQNEAGNPEGNVQYMGLSDFTFQAAGTAASDLSLSKTVSNANPASGAAISYTLNLTNAGPQADSNVQVEDILPSGFNFTSASGFGNYAEGSGIWTVPTIASGQTRTITLNGTVSAPPGVTITNYAQVRSQTSFDTDSSPGNASNDEDDDDTATFTVQGSRTAGTPPNFGSLCPAVNQILFDWDTVSWTPGSRNNSYPVAGVGTINWQVTSNGTFLNDPAFGGASPALANANNGGFAGTQLSLHQFLDFANRSQVATTVLTLPTAVPAVQFTVFDVDFAADDFADKLTVTGSFNGASVNPTLTNGTANYVVGNTVIGDQGSGGTSGAGNVVVTFSSPVDTITITYGNASTAPPNPDGQAIAIHDVNLCRPAAQLNITKISQVVEDPVNNTEDPKSIPGATVRYCILISNPGSATVTAVNATDNLPAQVTYVLGSMQSGASCGATNTAEDDDATGGDESDPFGASFAGTTVTATAATLNPTQSYALSFRVTVD